MRTRRPTVISLYSGVGGLDYGFEAAGFSTSVALEFDQPACATLRHNRKRWAVLEEDILKTSTEGILAAGNLAPGEADVLIGGPPCQPFSKSGYWATGDSARLTDPRSTTLGAYLRVLRESRPKTFLLENVAGLTFSGKDEGLQLLLREIEKINQETGTQYRPFYQVLKAAEHGVPQLRERVFVVGSRDGKTFHFPDGTHRPADHTGDMFDGDKPAYVTAWDALHDVSPSPDEDLKMRGKWADLLPSIPEGQNYLWHTERGGGLPLFGWRRRYWSFLLKLAKNKPSWTLQAQPGPATGPFHWDNRRLSMRELCRLQTVPDDIEVVGSLQAIQSQLGNAVPSLLAEVIARAMRSQLLGHRYRTSQPKLAVKRAAMPPTPRASSKVPTQYLRLVGEHAAHPGTGKGYSALNRNDESHAG